MSDTLPRHTAEESAANVPDQPYAPWKSGPDAVGLGHTDRVRLESLRYATVPEAAEYLAIMRTFTSEIAGLLSDQSAAEVAARLRAQGMDLDPDTADARLSYLVEDGKLARRPRDNDGQSVVEDRQASAG